ncbi:hypothetical protein BKH41_05985 [Helicobacter sp. 12S02232-10]|uniref:hypothetical protein n=1 Tax=Helicobacter sp. 12S02232-10 TaxID=1476197 RepID=UPI000BA721EA|nr:hypothetical protein [Helicobacter sp. 12S02232-10]PAF48262.1 hypothetical protein BKH41_05985 [Helicobacter sp. 12S02232-10]
MKYLLSLLYPLVFFLIWGCASYQGKIEHFNKLYYEENQEKAYDFSKKFIKNDLLWEIQNGINAFVIGKYEESLKTLDEAETLLNKNQAQNIFSSSFDNIGATLINDNVKSYHGNIYEGILINYYKALDAMVTGDEARARIEFNRANDRQRRAKEYYQKEIQADLKKNKDNQTKKNTSSEKLDTNTSQEQVDSILNSQYSNLKHFKAYDGFVNPLISYVSGLYFSLQKDPKGIDLLKESYGINHSDIIGEDLVLFQTHSASSKKYTWIIIEDGKSSSKKEFTIEMPPIVVDKKIYYFKISVPELEDGVNFYTSFKLKAKNAKKFDEISIFDGVIANEFSKQLPYILTRAIISAGYKTSLQITLNELFGDIGGIVGALFSATTTFADTRITTVFPHKVWLTRLQNYQGKVILKGNEKNIFDFELIDCKQKDPLTQTAQTDHLKICKNTDNLIYIRTTKNNIIPKLLIGEKQ